MPQTIINTITYNDSMCYLQHSKEAVSCNTVTGNSTLMVMLVYRMPNISRLDNEKVQNATEEASKRAYIIGISTVRNKPFRFSTK